MGPAAAHTRARDPRFLAGFGVALCVVTPAAKHSAAKGVAFRPRRTARSYGEARKDKHRGPRVPATSQPALHGSLA